MSLSHCGRISTLFSAFMNIQNINTCLYANYAEPYSLKIFTLHDPHMQDSLIIFIEQFSLRLNNHNHHIQYGLRAIMTIVQSLNNFGY